MDAPTRRQLIDQYKDGYRAVAEALAGADDRELDARPAPGKWTAREIVHHLADSEMTSAIRLRLLVKQESPADPQKLVDCRLPAPRNLVGSRACFDVFA